MSYKVYFQTGHIEEISGVDSIEIGEDYIKFTDSSDGLIAYFKKSIVDAVMVAD